MDNLSVCPNCKAYFDAALYPIACPECKRAFPSNESVRPEPPAESALPTEDGYIRCPKCGDLVSTRYRPVRCYKCGPIAVDPNLLPKAEPIDIPTYLVPNIVLCFFTCLILGIPGIVFSALAISAKNKGDIDKAISRASTAKNFMILNAIIAGLVVLGWIGNHLPRH